MLDRLAQRYNRRPSEILQISDPWLAIDFDFACAVRGNKADQEDMKKSSRNAPEQNTEKEFWREVNKVRSIKGLKPVWPKQ